MWNELSYDQNKSQGHEGLTSTWDILGQWIHLSLSETINVKISKIHGEKIDYGDMRNKDSTN